MKVSVKIIIVVMLLAWIGAGPANARESTTVRMTTASLIKGDDISGSRLEAIRDAKERCIREVLCSHLLDKAACLEHNEKLESLFLRDPVPYIEKFFIENEEITEDWQRYQVSVTANLRSNAMKVALLENGIGRVIDLVRKPTVMILVRERFETRVSGTRTVEMRLAKMFQERGFTVIDPEQKKLIDLRNRLYSESAGDKEAALAAGMGFKADYLISGEAVVTSSGPLSGTDLKARYANLSVKIVESGSGQIVAAEEGQGKSKHIDELTGGNWALENAAHMVGENVLICFESLLRDELVSGTIIVVHVHGLQSSIHVKEIESLLRQTVNVLSVYQRFHFSGMAEFEVTFKGTTAELADVLGKAEVGGRPLYVFETLPRYLRVSCRGEEGIDIKDSPEILNNYLKEKYERIDFEKGREQDKELAGKINELVQSRNISDEQKKQLFASQKEIEEKQKEAFYRERELEKRTEELRKAKTYHNEVEIKYARLVKDLERKVEGVAGSGESKEAELKGVKTDKKNLEDRYEKLLNVLEEKTKKAYGEREKEKKNYEKIFREAKDQFDDLCREVKKTGNWVYTASKNHSNAKTNKASSIFEYIEAIAKGADLAKQIADLISIVR